MFQPPHEFPLDRGAKIRLAAGTKAMSDAVMLGTIAGAIAALGDLVILGAVFADPRVVNSALIGWICVAWFSGSLGLLTLWFGLGRDGLYFRLLLAALGALFLLISIWAGRRNWEVVLIARSLLSLVAAAAPFSLLRLAGFQFAYAGAPRSPGNGSTNARRRQFSLRELFAWTIVAALLARAASVAHLAPREWMALAGAPAVFSLIAIGAVGVTSLPGGGTMVAIGLEILCGIVMLAARGFAILFLDMRRTDDDLIGLVFASLGHVLLISFVLLLYRRLGYRLWRRGWHGHNVPTNNASAS
jgi:hypothetical protein